MQRFSLASGQQGMVTLLKLQQHTWILPPIRKRSGGNSLFLVQNILSASNFLAGRPGLQVPNWSSPAKSLASPGFSSSQITGF